MAALGLSMIFGTTGLTNFAHGELITFGALVAYGVDSLPGTIRGDFAVDVGRNICHGSDAVESANAEIAHWFPEGVVAWASHSAGQLYE